MPRGVLRGIELINVGRRDRRRPAPGSQIFRLHVGVASKELHFTPAAPATLVATVRLTVRQFLAEPLHTASETRGVDPRGGAPRTLHYRQPLSGSAVMLPQLRSWRAQ